MNHQPSPAHPNNSDVIYYDPRVYVVVYPPKSRGLFVLLGLFLGFLGVHNFYAGRIRWGISHLLYTILLGWLILPQVLLAVVILFELCTVKTDGNGRPMA